MIKEHKLQSVTKSDTEVILRMYIKYGADCLQYFNGMFAFVIFNQKTKNFFIARDRLGIKPLYYWNKGEDWIISSEISPILKLPVILISVVELKFSTSIFAIEKIFIADPDPTL